MVVANVFVCFTFICLAASMSSFLTMHFANFISQYYIVSRSKKNYPTHSR